MYFIDYTGSPQKQAVLKQHWPELKTISPSELGQVSANHLVLADVDLFLTQHWSHPTIVLANKEQGAALATAWQRGAVAGWLWQSLPADPVDTVKQLQSAYFRHQDCRDLPSAAKLQQQLLPQIPQLDHYQIRRFFRAAAFLSGDWIDFWPINERYFLFYLADVSGHGVTSSLLSTWMAAFHGRADTPQSLLTQMNQLLLEQNSSKHITALCGLLDQELHQIHWCSAGHYPPAIVIQPQSAPQILTTSSFPLGLAPMLNIRMQTVDLSVGSQVIFASDGALEPFSGSLQQQLDQLIDQLVTHRFAPPEDLLDDIAIFSLERIS